MSKPVQFANPILESQSGLQRQTNLHLMFYDPTAADLELRLQEVRMLHPGITISVQPLQPTDAVGQITKALDRVLPGSVQSLFLVSGKESTTECEENGDSYQSRADRRLATWGTAFNQDGVCYLLGHDLAGLARQLAETTQIDIKREFVGGQRKLTFDEVIFVDHAASNFDTLIQALLQDRDAEIVSLDPERDGLHQIAGNLAGRAGVKTLHLICPGNESSLILGQTVLSCKNLQHRYRSVLGQISKALAKDAEIRIYNSEFNTANRGVDTIREISNSTGAFVVVASSQSRQLRFDSEFIRRFPTPQTTPTETEEWGRRFSPLPTMRTDTFVNTTWHHSPDLSWNQAHNELLIRTQFDHAQALGWLCIGFVSGCASLLVTYASGWWGW
jgi:hypothetical protein